MKRLIALLTILCLACCTCALSEGKSTVESFPALGRMGYPPPLPAPRWQAQRR